MSMTISTTSYFSNIQQNTRASGEEMREGKNSAAGAGKTQQSSASASLDQINLGQDGAAVNEVSRQQGSGQSAAKKQYTASPAADTVEISEDGQAASVKLQEQKAARPETEQTDQYETEDLSEYTDTELKQMYYKGEITRQEYEDETGETLE